MSIVEYIFESYPSYSTAGRYNCVSKSGNGTGHLELGKWNTIKSRFLALGLHSYIRGLLVGKHKILWY